jgi:hypothetical protein
MTKKKYKSGKLTPITEHILVEALKLWQEAFIEELGKMKAEGKQPMFHENWTSLMLREFGMEFGIDELSNTEPVND